MITQRAVSREWPGGISERFVRWVLGETFAEADLVSLATLAPQGVSEIFINVDGKEGLAPLRRFVDLESLALERARDLSPLTVLPKLRQLALFQCELIESLESLVMHDHLETLILSESWDPGLDWGDVAPKRLRALHLERTFIAGGAWFDQIEHLTMSQPWCQGSDPHWIPGSDRLRTLRLCHCLYQRDLDFVSRWPALRELVYDSCEPVSLAPLRQLKELEALTLTFGGDNPDLEALADLPRLRSLGFPGGVLSERSLQVIAALPNLRELELGEAVCDERPLTRESLPDRLRAITTFSPRHQS